MRSPARRRPRSSAARRGPGTARSCRCREREAGRRRAARSSSRGTSSASPPRGSGRRRVKTGASWPTSTAIRISSAGIAPGCPAPWAACHAPVGLGSSAEPAARASSATCSRRGTDSSPPPRRSTWTGRPGCPAGPGTTCCVHVGDWPRCCDPGQAAGRGRSGTVAPPYDPDAANAAVVAAHRDGRPGGVLGGGAAVPGPGGGVVRRAGRRRRAAGARAGARHVRGRRAAAAHRRQRRRLRAGGARARPRRTAGRRRCSTPGWRRWST